MTPVSEILNKFAGLRTWLLELPRAYKRAIAAVNDLALLTLALWLAMSFRLSELYVPLNARHALLLAAAPLIAVGTFAWFGLYRLVTRFIGQGAIVRIIVAVGLSVLLWALVVFMSGLALIAVPRSVVILYGLFAVALITASRQFAAWLFRDIDVPLPQRDRSGRRVVVFGAGPMGVQLAEAMHRTGQATVVGFLDQTESLWGQYVSGLKVYRPEKIDRLIERESVTEVVLALPKARRRDRRVILADLQRRPIRVTTLPAIEEFAAGRVTISDVRPVEVADLLGRDAVPPDPHLLSRHIKGKSVMVTGAGGSIGSELVRQILEQQPRVLVLYELSEAALYEIEVSVLETFAALPAGVEPPIIAGVLGSVLDEERMHDTIRRYGVATIYHAAAYKHVPIVEHNVIAGLSNNTFGTSVAAQAARDLGVEQFVLISTDKAVRPTNVMGASKRLAELILQAHAADPACRTVFTMVRFGNVLDSSGSVVRRFRKQIEAGGPVTVTHPEIIRYFMSVSEAAELVIQAGAMAAGGEVFVLDMGEPVKIDELARLMIRRMGLEVRDERNPGGDVAIEYIGLRAGEKLFEELLLDENTLATEHPRIMRNTEPSLPFDRLERELGALRAAMAAADAAAIRAVLWRTVEGYRPNKIGGKIGAECSSGPGGT